MSGKFNAPVTHVCHRVTFVRFHRAQSVNVDEPNATLPVRTKSGGQRWVVWGRRRQEQCSLPLGGWAELSTISRGHWNRWRPTPVKLLIDRFAVSNPAGQEYEFSLDSNQYLQGLMASSGTIQRVYVVTVLPLLRPILYENWPRIIGNGGLVAPWDRP